MVELIDNVLCWLIVNSPNWTTTRFFMHWRYLWFSKYRRWSDDDHRWEKRA